MPGFYVACPILYICAYCRRCPMFFYGYFDVVSSLIFIWTLLFSGVLNSYNKVYYGFLQSINL